jgi:hypothetical protein
LGHVLPIAFVCFTGERKNSMIAAPHFMRLTEATTISKHGEGLIAANDGLLSLSCMTATFIDSLFNYRMLGSVER